MNRPDPRRTRQPTSVLSDCHRQHTHRLTPHHFLSTAPIVSGCNWQVDSSGGLHSSMSSAMKDHQPRSAASTASPSARSARTRPAIVRRSTLTCVNLSNSNEAQSHTASGPGRIASQGALASHQAARQARVILSAWVSELLEMRRTGRMIPGWCDQGSLAPFSDAD